MSVRAFGQNFRPAIYGSESGAFVPSGAVETALESRCVCSYRTGGESARAGGVLGLDVDMGLGQRTGNASIGLDPSEDLAPNVDQTFIWSNAPTSFECVV